METAAARKEHAEMLNITPTEDASWRPLYEAVRGLDHGATITFDDIIGWTGIDVRSKGRWIVYRVDKELQRNDTRALSSVRGVGYRIALPEEHAVLINTRRKRARRQTHKGITAGLSADLSRIGDPEVRNVITRMTVHLQGIESRLAYQEKRIARTEETLREVRRETKTTAAQVEERLAKLESLVSSKEEQKA